MGILRYDSDLIRKGWMVEGLLHERKNSFFAGYVGTSSNNIIYQVNKDSKEKEGITTVFDFRGQLTQGAIQGAETAAGKGEDKKRFSHIISVDKYRYVVKNGSAFDAVQSADLNSTSHSDSRSLLADLFIRQKDQYFFDCMQGNLIALSGIQDPTHIFRDDVNPSVFNLDFLIRLSQALKTSTKFTVGGPRMRLRPYKVTIGSHGQTIPYWLFLVDTYMIDKLRRDPLFNTLMASSDVRGSDNRNISGVIGTIGNIMLVEAPTANSPLTGNSNRWRIRDIEVENQGMRTFTREVPTDSTSPPAIWSGHDNFNYDSDHIWSRGMVLGNSAVQFGNGKSPDYKYQEDRDFATTSESVLESWFEVQRTILKKETEDYKIGKVTDIDYGIINVDVKHIA